MRFGPVPLAQAGGAVLAHSVDTGAGRLRKGRVLTSADLAALAALGLGEITVARLDPGDVAEDDAALALAQRLVTGAGLRLAPVGTGRVNIHATGPGVVRIDAGRIHAANAADPMITIATVPEWQRVTDGTMVATVKIIAWAVAGDALARACAAAQGALAHCPPVAQTAVLIETSVGEAGVLAKGRRVTEQRLNRLGVALIHHIVVPHRAGALAQALAAAPDAGLVLILTGSATSDPNDVAPAAVRAAGGQVDHVGMPVDPGNLLFLGRFRDRPLIGLPGCARSPALNGADWVLERLACGIDVSPLDIQRMGVGGLLMEIPTRPQPRDPA
jgi:molybdenum cofactor cytidylyltransferase